MSISNPNHIYDVIVVGAGPVGLATAIGLYRRGIKNILVIDQTRAFRQVGQVVDILPNGLKALKYLDYQVYEEVKKAARFQTQEQQASQPPLKWAQRNFHGKLVRSTQLGYDEWLQNYGEGRLSISWYDLQTTLRLLLPQDLVKANHRCIDILDEKELGYVRIDCTSDTTIEPNPFAHWAEGDNKSNSGLQELDASQQLIKKSFRAKLIIAADGINSTVRKLIYQDSEFSHFAQPEYSGYAAIACREITNTSNELKLEIETKFLHDSLLTTISNDEISQSLACMEDPRMIIFSRQAIQFGYMIHLPVPLDLLQEASGSALVDLALKGLTKARFPNSLQELVSVSPPSNMYKRPYYIHRAIVSNYIKFPGAISNNTAANDIEIIPPWSARRVVLAGDAAHGMPPFTAQGANQGFEDAILITKLITNIAQNHNLNNIQAITEAYKKYEQQRRPLMAYIQQATMRQFTFSENDAEYVEFKHKIYHRDVEAMLEV